MEISRKTAHKLIAEYGEWVEQHETEGWSAYLVTFMFKWLPGINRDSILDQMRRGVEGFYSTLVTRVVRNSRSPSQQQYLPRLIGAPDLPVFKHVKQSLNNVCINGGLHVHAIVLIPGKSRLRTGLAEHVREKYAKYVHEEGCLAQLDVQPITATIKRAADYGLKGVKNQRFSTDDLLILPKVLSELGPKVSRQPEQKEAGKEGNKVIDITT